MEALTDPIKQEISAMLRFDKMYSLIRRPLYETDDEFTEMLKHEKEIREATKILS